MTNLARPAAFRFGVVFAVVSIAPFPFDALPKSEWITGLYTRGWDWLVSHVAALAGIALPAATSSSGSGDTTADYVGLLTSVALALFGTVVWLVIDRRKPEHRVHPRLSRAVLTLMRYWLAAVLLGYGLAKLFNVQFQTPMSMTLHERVGDLSPMGLLWAFMGSSRPYAFFGGLMECLGGVLLLWRRTTTMGALVAAAVLLNVVMMNLCYDVPVKIHSMMYFVTAVVLISLDARRLISVLIGNAAAARESYPRASRGMERTRIVIKTLFIGWVIIGGIIDNREAAAQFDGPPSPLQGSYEVESFVEQNAAPGGDLARWANLTFDRTLMTMTTAKGESSACFVEFSLLTPSFSLVGTESPFSFSYRRLAGERLEVVGGTATKSIRLVLHKKTAENFLLLNRGFHWVNEFPFNR